MNDWMRQQLEQKKQREAQLRQQEEQLSQQEEQRKQEAFTKIRQILPQLEVEQKLQDLIAIFGLIYEGEKLEVTQQKKEVRKKFVEGVGYKTQYSITQSAKFTARNNHTLSVTIVIAYSDSMHVGFIREVYDKYYMKEEDGPRDFYKTINIGENLTTNTVETFNEYLFETAYKFFNSSEYRRPYAIGFAFTLILIRKALYYLLLCAFVIMIFSIIIYAILAGHPGP